MDAGLTAAWGERVVDAATVAARRIQKTEKERRTA